MRTMLTVERIGDPAVMASLEPVWDALIAQDAAGHAFLTHTWITTWWQHFGADNELWLLLVKDGAAIIGIAPMMLSRTRYGGLPVRVLGFMSNRHVSRCEIIAPQRRAEVIVALAKYWKAQSRLWDMLRLNDLPQNSDTLRILRQALLDVGMHVGPPEPSKELVYLDMLGTAEAYVAAKGRKFRWSIRTAIERLHATGTLRTDKHTAPPDVREAVGRLFGLQEISRKQAEPDKLLGETDVAFCSDVAQAFAARGNADVHMLLLDERTICGCLCLIYNETVYGLVTYFDEAYKTQAPGVYLFHHMACTYWNHPRIRRFDYNGSALYVRRWSNAAVRYETVTAWHRRPYSQLVGGLRRLKRRLQDRAGQAAPAAST